VVKIGGSRLSIGALLASEAVTVLALGGALAVGLTILTGLFGAEAVRSLLLG
jgi:hypothetical protein